MWDADISDPSVVICSGSCKKKLKKFLNKKIFKQTSINLKSRLKVVKRVCFLLTTAVKLILRVWLMDRVIQHFCHSALQPMVVGIFAMVIED